MIAYFVRHPTAANLLMLLMVAVGIAALPSLKRETFPDFAPQQVEIRVPFPGAAASDVEEAICLRLEDAIDAVTDVAELRCEAREGVAITVAKMTEGADEGRFMDDLKTAVEAIDSFPEQVEQPVIRQLGRTDQVISIAVTGPLAATDLKAYAEALKTRLQQLPQISQVAVQGFSEHQFRVAVPMSALRRYGLSVQDVASAVQRQGIKLPGGTLDTSDQTLLVRFDDERRSPRAIADLVVVGGASGAAVRLGDLATVTDRFALDEAKVSFGGRRAALLDVTKTKAQDSLVVVAAVRAFVARERTVAPPGVTFTLTEDVASIVSDRLRLLLSNGLEGLALVVLVMWLFFRARFALWVAMGLPVSFLAGLAMMALLGYSVNMITMVALLIALGLLMDDAIVIAENIAARLRSGASPIDAAIDGTREVAPGVLASFLTTSAVFVPLAFISGDIGKILGVLPVALLLVLVMSLIEAFLILPHHLAHSLRNASATPNRFRKRFDAGLDWVRERVLGRAVDLAVHWRYAFLGLMLAAFLGSLGMVAGGSLKFRAFPKVDGDQVAARILLPQGTPLARTEAVVARIVAAMERVNVALTPRQPNGASLVRNVSVRYGVNADAHESGPHLATVNVDLLTTEVRNASLDTILADWRKQVGALPDVISVGFKRPQIGPAGLAIDVRLSGPDLGELRAASHELQAWLARYRGVKDLLDDLRPGKRELRLRLKPGALALGLDATTIATQVRAAFYGVTAKDIQVGREPYAIEVRLRDDDRSQRRDLEDFRIVTPAGKLVPLSAVVDISSGRGYARIHRIDRARTVSVQGEVDGRIANAIDILNDTKTRFLRELHSRHPSVTVAFSGQSEEGSTTAQSIARGFGLGIFGVFLLLSFQFRSYVDPLAVMAVIPLALIGAVWGHLLMGLDLSMPSMMGLVSLAGIVVNDSILLVEFLKRQLARGMSVSAAATRASRERFRAVLLTSLTTVAGLLPILAERSPQAQILIPLITSLVFGLMVTTVLVLLLVPAVYTILDDFGVAGARRPEMIEGTP